VQAVACFKVLLVAVVLSTLIYMVALCLQSKVLVGLVLKFAVQLGDRWRACGWPAGVSVHLLNVAVPQVGRSTRGALSHLLIITQHTALLLGGGGCWGPGEPPRVVVVGGIVCLRGSFHAPMTSALVMVCT